VRRLLSFSLGLGLGLVVGGNLVRRLDAVQQRFAPDRLGVAASVLVDTLRARVSDLAAARRADEGGPWTR
jgi:VanZ family protein